MLVLFAYSCTDYSGRGEVGQVALSMRTSPLPSLPRLSLYGVVILREIEGMGKERDHYFPTSLITHHNYTINFITPTYLYIFRAHRLHTL